MFNLFYFLWVNRLYRSVPVQSYFSNSMFLILNVQVSRSIQFVVNVDLVHSYQLIKLGYFLYFGEPSLVETYGS